MNPPPRYVMLENNGLQPPPHRRHLPRYHNHESSSGCSCMKCFCFCYCCIFIIILLAFAATGFMFFFVDPKVPTYQVENFNVKKFDIENGNKLNTEFTVVVKTENPNQGIAIEYGKNSEVSIWYLDTQIGSGPIPQFRQPLKINARVPVTLEIQGYNLREFKVIISAEVVVDNLRPGRKVNIVSSTNPYIEFES